MSHHENCDFSETVQYFITTFSTIIVCIKPTNYKQNTTKLLNTIFKFTSLISVCVLYKLKEYPLQLTHDIILHVMWLLVICATSYLRIKYVYMYTEIVLFCQNNEYQ